MEAIFVDTSAWDAIEDEADSHHAAALSSRWDSSAALERNTISCHKTHTPLSPA